MRLLNWFVLRFWPGRILKKFHSATARKVFFLKQYEANLKRIWGLEFAIKGLKDAREILRREYDKLTEDIDGAKVAAKANDAKEDPDKTLRETFDKIIETKSREIEEWKKKVDLADEQIQNTQGEVDAYYVQLPNLKREIYE